MSRINCLNETNLIGHVANHAKEALSGPSLAFALKTTERWNGGAHTEYHYCVVFNPRIAEFVSKHCPQNSLLHIKGTLRHNSHNGRTDILVRELRKLA